MGYYITPRPVDGADYRRRLAWSAIKLLWDNKKSALGREEAMSDVD
jgi:hypothetical protein